MKLRLTLLAASLALAATPVLAAEQMMAGPTVLASAQQNAGLVAQLKAAHGLEADHSFKVNSEHPGAAGTKIVRLSHTFKGLRILQSESIIVMDKQGKLVSESVADRRQGLRKNAGGEALTSKGVASTTPVLGTGVAGKDFETSPKLSGQDAIAVAVNKVAPNGTHTIAPEAELVIYPIMETRRKASAVKKTDKELNALDMEDVLGGYELAYLVKTRMESAGRPALYNTIVSAIDGRILKQISAMHNVVGVGNSQYNGQVPISTSFDGTNYKMIDTTRGTGGSFGAIAITNANHGSSTGAVYTNSTNTWGDGQQFIPGGSTTNANGQTAAVNALWGMMNTYDTLKNVLGWQSLDGNNTATHINVHVNNNYENAYYTDSCRCMFIGDGASYFYNLGSIDVIGHEMGHGVTAATSDLIYSGESGGLNESNSDIVGDMVEAYARAGGTGSVIPASGNDWEVGKEIARNGVALRFMRKPSKDGSSPDAWSPSLGDLDVHYSSGPNNRMFYFLSQGSNATPGNEAYSQYLTGSPAAMTGIGNDKAFRIWFKANTTKFTSSTNYADARAKVIQVAQEMYGVGSKEETAVKRAYAAINVGEDVDEGPQPLSLTGHPSNATVMFGGTASFTVGAKGGTAPYAYQWYKNGQKVTGATAATYSFTTKATDNGATVYAVVTDSVNASLTSNTARLTVSTTPTELETMSNGGFEQGAVAWVGNTNKIGSFPQQPAFEGSKNAWLGNKGSTSTESLYQTVSIPADFSTVMFSFQLHIDTAETTTRVAYDKLKVEVKDTNGNVLKTLATYSNLDKAAGYQARSFDLSAYKGQTVRISFTSTEDISLQTSFVLDKVSVLAK